ncbi:MAG: GH1 family beta-glucosidase [Candidatus Methylacidiphilales bacterium]|nr:GH1 family beta-glucosidase [Candidatus Methylacidiphilales bacterium]
MIKPRPLTFPKKFVWGFAAAAPQIEGAAFTDGKGESIWDRFAHTQGLVLNNDNLDVACDHYHLFDEDFKLMSSLGAKHYRLSLAWPRIYPDGDGAVNQKGLDFYHRLFDSMEKHGLTPWVTMFHWDLPQALETNFGGWRDRRVTSAFGTYAETIVKAYGDRVKNWITLNEIFCFTHLGYGNAQKAPGLILPAGIVNQTYHHALICHGLGVQAVREYGGKGARVGLTDNSDVIVPVSETPEDIAAAQKEFRRVNARTIDAMYRGEYSSQYLSAAGGDAPKVEKGDFKIISLPTDFLGLNIYTGQFAREGKNGKPEIVAPPESFPTTSCWWHRVVPQSLYWGPRHVAEIYGEKAIYITENGCSYVDAPPTNGEVHDLHRRELIRSYLGELHRSIVDGVPVKGYFVWSFMDNFEWEEGYTRRFGVVYCDFETQKRTPKLSALWYQKVIESNTLV